MQGWTRRAESLTWLRADLGTTSWPPGADARADVVREKDRLRASGDHFGAAKLGGILAAEAQIRARRVLERWRGRIDPETG